MNACIQYIRIGVSVCLCESLSLTLIRANRLQRARQASTNLQQTKVIARTAQETPPRLQGAQT
jgi:hypothetical protein